MEHISASMQTMTNWTGSRHTEEAVRKEIRRRWGEQDAKEYDPRFSARTFNQWRKLGFTVKAGEKAIRSVTAIEEKDTAGNTIQRHYKQVSLFYLKQVELQNKQ